MQRIRDDLYRARFAFIAVILYFIVMEIAFGMTCPIRALTGIECPTCGLSRAAIALFSGRFTDAYIFNRTIYLWVPLFVIFFFDRYIKKLFIDPFPILFIVVCALTIANYVLKFI